jgi:hypothetical protein
VGAPGGQLTEAEAQEAAVQAMIGLEVLPTRDPIVRPGADEDPLLALESRLEQLGSASGGEGRWNCPAHRERLGFSLAVGRARNGMDVVLHCFAGCSTQRVLTVLGWEMRDLYHPENRKERWITRDVFGRPLDGQEDVDKKTHFQENLRRSTSSCPTRDSESTSSCPRPLVHGPLPEDADKDTRWFATDLLALIQERVSSGNLQAVPYSCRFGAERRGWPTSKKSPAGATVASDLVKKVNRILKALVEAGTFQREEMRPRGQPRGTYAYMLPSETPMIRPRPEAPAVGVEPVVQPGEVVRKQRVVDQAQPVRRQDLGVVASGDGAAARDDGAASYAGGELHAAGIPSPPYTRRN